MTTHKPDGAGPTEEDFKKANECWDVIDNMTCFREATRERVVEVIAQEIASERVEAEKKVRIYREIAIDCEKRYRKESGNVVPYIQHEFVSVEIDQEAERLLKEETK